MSRMDILSKPGLRSATVGMEAFSHRHYFNVNRQRIFARTHLLIQPLKDNFSIKYMGQIKAGDFSSLTKLIGTRLAKQAQNADQLKVMVATASVTNFNFYAGENKAGKKVVLVELI